MKLAVFLKIVLSLVLNKALIKIRQKIGNFKKDKN